MKPEIIERIAELFPGIIRKGIGGMAFWTDSIDEGTGIPVLSKEWDYVARLIEEKLDDSQWFYYFLHLSLIIKKEFLSLQIKDYMIATPEQKITAVIKTLKPKTLST